MKSYNKQYIGGEWREGKGEQLANHNPYTERLLYSYRAASREDVNDAYEAAQAAQAEWSVTTPAQRQNHLKKLIPVFEEMRDELTACSLEEGGKVPAIAQNETNECITAVEDCLHYPSMLNGTLFQSNRPGKDVIAYREAKGVVGVISPWNMPFVLATRNVMPALACGNTVVLKPSSDTPASAFVLAEAFDKAGFPKGVFNAVAGKGSEIGDYFVTHPIPAMHSFTGSSPVGKHIAELAGQEFKDVALELGGNNVMIVLEDADIERAAEAAIRGKFWNCGQICMAINRFIVMDTVYDKFTEALVAMIKLLQVGDPASPATFIGPLINKTQVASVEKLIRGTIAAGAVVTLEGKTEGNVVSPWVFTEVTNDMPAAANEIFGPVASIIRVKDEEEAVRLANETEYGLSGCLWTRDVYRGLQLSRQIKTGNMHVNDHSIYTELHIMFGGEKASGKGRTGGQWSINTFTTEKIISIQP